MYTKKRFPTIEDVVSRYNDSVSDLVNSNNEKTTGHSKESEKFIRQAGESMSEALEYALKYHLHMIDPHIKDYQYQKSTPELIKVHYWNPDDRNQKQGMYDEVIDGVISDVDFEFMFKNKALLTNAAKHEGGEVDEIVLRHYMKEVRKFILEYLDKNADLKDEAYYNKTEFNHSLQFYLKSATDLQE